MLRHIHHASWMLAGLMAVALAPVVAQAGNHPCYRWDEARNPGGANRCTSNDQCDGARTCSAAGWCQGTSRDPRAPKGPNYCWDEARNPGGANRCTNDRQCDGARTCSSAGWCQGTAR